jgi:RNA polymerase sigma-70 factor (ECF subfamily)
MRQFRTILGGLPRKDGFEGEQSKYPARTADPGDSAVAAKAALANCTDPATRHKLFVEYLFAAYRLPLLRYLTKLLRNTDDAHDVIQQTYVRLLEAEQLDELEGRARAYLFTTAKNLAYDSFRHKARWGAVELDELQISSSEPQPESVADWEQGLAIIRESLLDLEPRTRQVFLLHVVKGMSYRTIAKELDISTKTVERDIRLVLDLCQDRLKVWQRT